MTLTTASADATSKIILIGFVAVFLAVATVWISLVLAKAVFPGDVTHLEFFLTFVVVIIPFVILIYFGLAIIIYDAITAPPWPTALPLRPSRPEVLAAAVTYIGLSGWLWLRWRNPTAPSTRILGPAIIATLIILIIVSVIWTAHHDHIF